MSLCLTYKVNLGLSLRKTKAKQEIIRGRHEAEAILCIALTSIPVCEVT